MESKVVLPFYPNGKKSCETGFCSNYFAESGTTNYEESFIKQTGMTFIPLS